MAHDKVLEIRNAIDPDSLAESIAQEYARMEDDRAPWKALKAELKQYLYATDTSMTSAGTLPWRNKTVLPKLTQIYDNLMANYEMALFPNDDWMKWEAYSISDDLKKKIMAIEAYMSTKTRDSNFRQVIRECLSDYIIYGRPYATVEWVNEKKVDPVTGDEIPGYVGPRAVHVTPLDLVYDYKASTFQKTPKIRRVMKTIGQLKADMRNKPEDAYYASIINKVQETRNFLSSYEYGDVDKALQLNVDGFNNLLDYYNSQYVEILEFEGDIYDNENNKLWVDRNITVIDRLYVARNEPRKSWMPNTDYCSVAWRERTDNLYGMSPLDNLVGIQYRIDHLENLKSDALDMAVFPPLKIKGVVEEFQWGPGEEILVGDDGDVEEMGRNLNGVITAENQIAMYEQKMEEMAGSPKQAMGFRTPGEKTAYEVNQLESAASRIFQYKITKFETEFLEPLLNLMLETARRNLTMTDVVRNIDTEFGIQRFIDVTRDDITANGRIRPVGARHFAARSQLIQNLTGLFNSQLGQLMLPHVDSKQLAMLVEDTFAFTRFQIFRPYAAIAEQKELQSMKNTAEDQVLAESMTDTEEPNGPLGGS